MRHMNRAEDCPGLHQGESSGLRQKAWNSWTHHIKHWGARKDQDSITMGTWQIGGVIIFNIREKHGFSLKPQTVNFEDRCLCVYLCLLFGWGGGVGGEVVYQCV